MLTQPNTKPDPKTEVRVGARDQTVKDREEALVAGLDELDQWLADQIGAELAGVL
jgi:hypothetical protein